MGLAGVNYNNKFIILMIAESGIFSPRHGPQAPLKVFNFHPVFLPPRASTPAQRASPLQRRSLTTSHTRRQYKDQSTSPTNLRTLHSSQLGRHSPERPQLLQTVSRYSEELEQPVGHNIHALREIMRERAIAFDQLPAYHFTQYQMNTAQRTRWHRSTLHTRKNHDSPFLRTLKPKKTVSTPEAEPGPTRKESSRKKMVLLGGSIPFRTVSLNPQESGSYSPLKSARRQLVSGNVGVMRRPRQVRPQAGVAEVYENDCRPWEVVKGEGMEESHHIYQFGK